ncbi:MAG: hypothetical protein JJU27_14045 [Gammaproteobacteria bacterium]|nr:hypothetical protein [Gammaproteobacteria bacterium]
MSILKHSPNQDLDLVVYTDRPLACEPLPIRQMLITGDEWNAWTGNGALTHLAKQKILLKCLEQVNQPVVYFDTDTLFLAAAESVASVIQRGSHVMHAYEGPIGLHPTCRGIVEWLGDGRLVEGEWLTANTPMYNSGIVGLSPDSAQSLQRAAQVAGRLLEVDPIFLLEQLATSACLAQARGGVQACDQQVIHYWGWRRAFIREALKDFLVDSSGCTLAQLLDRFDVRDIARQPAIHPLDKVKVRIQGLRGELDGNTRFALLALLSAVRAGAADQALANRWLRVHFRFLSAELPGFCPVPEWTRGVFDRLYTQSEGWLADDMQKAVIEWRI